MRSLSVRRVALLIFVLGSLPMLSEAQNCRRVRANAQNARETTTVSSTAITVADTNTSRCTLSIVNYSANDMRCADVSIDPVPTATTGLLFKANGGGWGFQLEGQGRWQCIRTGGADATAEVAEGMP